MVPHYNRRVSVVYARWVIRWRWPVLAVCLLAVAAAAFGLRNFQFSADYKVYFGPDNPELLAFQAFENTYTKSENILFVLQPADETDSQYRPGTDHLWLVGRLCPRDRHYRFHDHSDQYGAYRR
jgi:predicted RND superfamily exporter protein